MRAKPRQTLAGHLADALAVFRRLWARDGAVFLRRVADLGFDPDTFARLAPLAVYAHDLGKALDRWQSYLDTGRGRISHAVFSALMLRDLLRAGDGGPESGAFPAETAALLLAVLAHHQMLHDAAFQGENMQAAGAQAYSAEAVIDLMREWCGPSGPLSLRSLSKPAYTGSQGAGLAEQLRRRVAGLPPEKLLPFKALYTMLLALVRLCDNEASRCYGQWEKTSPRAETVAGALVGEGTPLRLAGDVAGAFARFMQSPAGQSPNDMQRRLAGGWHPFIILQAGCGTGKTAAALHYAAALARQGKINRVIFTLPTQFTTNSMYWDFGDKYGLTRGDTGIYHSEVESVLRAAEPEDERENRVAEEKFANTFFSKPVNVCTVDHLLYSLLHCYRYADRAFGHLMTAAVVFDEIHYYDRFTFRKIGQCLEILRQLTVPHLIMTATMPGSLAEYLIQEGRMDGAEYHFIRQGDGSDGNPAAGEDEPFVIRKTTGSMIGSGGAVSAELIALLGQNRRLRQMVVVNQVERAKTVARTIRRLWPEANVICYHSEFTRGHRSVKEKLIRALFRPVSMRSPEERKLIGEWRLADIGQIILVSTQVCELSLDISADVMYSEIAPVDAVAQRGGRLHRRGRRPERSRCACAQCSGNRLPPEHIYRLYLFPLDWRDVWAQMPYGGPEVERDILRRSWELTGDVYSFSRAAVWVDRLYPKAGSLRDDEMLRMLREDAVFGRRPRERYGDEAAEQSRGSFRARHSNYVSLTVVPAELLPAGAADAGAILQAFGVRVGRNKLLRNKEAWEVRPDTGINVLHLPYDRETGFAFN
ncbi:hypothetical protein A6M21_16935 [Desulfotomaculum copahuensis]|uniref:HD Cas3-type domain-containing protein n=1 Tax=Desulfotomaculum copahuensis TaxID=1838280 RepID=A0A1B7LID6_9FIRM|nr:hypothetical protein A6M21_16935 [Desulfotomaculum copahuensis]